MLGKDAQESAVYYHQLAKKIKKKIDGLGKAIRDTQGKLRKAKAKGIIKREAKIRIVREREWYESFGWSFTNSGKLILFGKNAKQNDIVVARHMEEGDLFFHADIRGGSATILKKGAEAGQEDKEFTAVIAAGFSKNWTRGFSQGDAYCVGKGQLSKHASGGFVGAGGFAISGKREWYKNTPLKLRIGIDEKGRMAVGAKNANWMKKSVVVVPGKTPKGKMGREIARILGGEESEFVHVLPSGSFALLTE
jgi:predicted ribosome quality control (RQC) complex YloA/Tae2 family protein